MIETLAIPYSAPLPLVPPPFHDELLISWLKRIGRINDMRLDHLLDYIGVGHRRIWRLDVDPNAAACESIAVATRRHPAQIGAMTFKGCLDHWIPLLSTKHDFQFCPTCIRKFVDPAGINLQSVILKNFELPVTLRHWRYAWNTACAVCGSTLVPHCVDALSPSQDYWARVRRPGLAHQGAQILADAIEMGGTRALRRCNQALHFSCWYYEKGDFKSMVMTSDVDTRHAGLCAIARAQHQPLRKVAWLLITGVRWRRERILSALRRSDSAKSWVRKSYLKCGPPQIVGVQFAIESNVKILN